MVYPKIKDLFSTWCANTTWHGIADLASTKSIISKCLWIFVLCFSTVMFCTNVSAHIADYMHGDTWQLVTYYVDYKDGAKFPNVTICSLNLVSEKRLKLMNMSYEAAAYVIDSILESTSGVGDDEEKDRKMKEAFIRYAGREKNRSLTEWISDLAPTCEDLFDGCVYGTPSRPSNRFNCCESIQDQYVPDYGSCFLLYPPEDMLKANPQKQEGENYGLHLYLNPEVADYAPVYQASAPDAGVLIYLGYTPENSVYSTPAAVDPGTHAWIGMRTERHQVEHKKQTIPLLYPLHIPSLNCYEGHEFSVVNGDYTFELCNIDCYAQYVLQICNCTIFTSVKPNISVCDPVTWHYCDDYLLQQPRNFGPLVKCRTDKCKKECTKTTVEVRASSTISPAPNYLQQLRDEIYKVEGVYHSDEVLSQFSIVDIFFDSTEVKIVETRERITVEQLISNIGGTLGVYGGISLITLYQLIVYLYCGCVYWIKSSKASKCGNATPKMSNGNVDVKEVEEISTKNEPTLFPANYYFHV